MHVIRLKHGLSITHPFRTDELWVVRAWLKCREDMAANTSIFFLSERRKALDHRTVWALIKAYGIMAEIDVAAHPHMLRHACGYALADQGADTRLIQDYLGHRSIQHTVLYTAANPARFEKLWWVNSNCKCTGEGLVKKLSGSLVV